MADCTVIMPRNVFARLPAYNPFVGTFHHAPSAGNRGAVYFSGEIVAMSELEERKKFRHHPLTGIFHSLPGYYDPLHRLCQFRNDEEEESQADTDSVRSFIAVDLHDTEEIGHSHVIGGPKPMSRMYSDSHFHLPTPFSHTRPRRFSDSDAESFYELNREKETREKQEMMEHLFQEEPETISIIEEQEGEGPPLLTRLRSNTIPPHRVEGLLREVHEEVRRTTKKRKSSSSSAQSTESDSSNSVDSFVHALERSSINMLHSISSSELNNGFISTGKGIFRKIGVRQSIHNDKQERLSDKEKNEEWENDSSEEYTQAAPREPLNPFVARRLNDGDELRIMAVHRHNAPRECVPHLVNSGCDEDDENASQPKPYFIHEEAVTEQYELVGEDQLGDGSYAVVKPAIHRANGKQVAIKQIHKRYLTTEESKAAVEREIEIHLRLRHRHIVRLYEVYETNDFLYLVMTKANKGNLKQLMQRKRRLPESLAAKMAQQIVRAVFFLHQSGVLHCDLKPENILLTDVKTTNQDSNDASSPTGLGRRSSLSSSLDPHADVKVCDLQVELCDFGLSVKVPDVRYYKLTGDVHKVPFTGLTGTPGYIAPELLQQQSYGKPVDMWSVGIVIFEMLTGYQPFYPAHACIHEKADFNDRVWKDISGQAKDLVMHLLQSDPTKRFTAADALSHTWFDTAAFAI